MCETLSKMVWKLEKLTTRRISISRALDFLEATTDNTDEIIVINILRESYNELLVEEHSYKTA
ncbi:MAG: hypothetical protein HQM14_14340 [SAR324 cluster bacterium]|nr:hypothetical protein [SAR324 cluster bacterium]